MVKQSVQASILRQKAMGAFFASFLLFSYACLTTAEDTLSVNMREADIRAVVQWMSEETGKNFVLDPRVRGKITVLSSQPMTRTEAYHTFLAALEVYGFSAIEQRNTVRIVPDSAAKTTSSDVIEAFKDQAPSHRVTHAIKVTGVSATDLATLLQPLIPATGHIGASAEANMIVVADSAQNVERLKRIIRSIEQQGKLDLEIISLKHAMAEEVMTLLNQLMARKQEGNPATIQFAADERSNSILMSGDPSQRSQMRQVIQRLDQPLANEGNTQVFYLHYLRSEELAAVLEGVADSYREADMEQASAKSKISIQASPTTNALVITASPLLLMEMESVIKKLDIRPAQVLVEAIIVEVNNDFVNSLGVEWSTGLDDNDGPQGAINFGLIPPTVDPELLEVNPLSLVGNGLTLGYFRNGSIRALVNALQAETSSNILSTPSIVTLDNHEAEILVGSNVPFVTGSSTGSASSTNDPFITIEREDIGVSLKIRPQINQGDAITLEILQVVETLTSATIAEDIITEKRSISTKVLLADDDILVLGGLIQDETSEIVQKVPLLGDIPLLGRLFRSKTDKTTKKNLMVFIHAVIISDATYAEKESRERYNAIRKKQHASQDPEAKPPHEEKPLLPEYDSHKSREPAAVTNSQQP